MTVRVETFLGGRVTQYCGDVRAVLASTPADHFDCVVTSPPYYGLRTYGTKAQIWGGTASCKHRWGAQIVDRSRLTPGIRGSGLDDGGRAQARASRFEKRSTFCQRCGAWRGELGLEPSIDLHVSNLVEIAAGVRRVIKPRGTFWVNYGDCYATAPNGRSAADTKANGEDDRTHRDKPFDTAKASGLKSGNLCLLPERIALAFQAAGWIVRSRIIWGKANTKPDSSGRYRPSYNHEMIWMFSRQMGCHYDATAVRRPTASATKGRLAQNVEGQQGSFRQPGKTNGPFKAVGEQDDRLLRAYEPADVEVWRMATASFEEAHFATFPPELAERCIKAGCPEGGSVLDPFGGAGTTALVAASLGRFPTLIELNPEYCVLARARIEAAFMGKDEGARHMTKQIGKTAADAGPLFAGAVP